MRISNVKLLTVFALSCLLLSCRSQAEPLQIVAVNEVGASAMPEEILPIKGAPFEMPALKSPVFPELTVSIADKVAGTDSFITSVVNQTIIEVHNQGGGTVVIPKGKWRSGRIILKSNINLHLEEGAEIEFSGIAEDYLPAVFTRHEGIEIMGAGAFIYANGENNIAVTGKGTIYGPPMNAEIRQRPNGNTVVENDIPVTTPINQRIFDGMDGRTFYRPKTISPINCTNVLIEGITMERSAFWNVCPIYCENVIIRGITVNSIGVPSGDGIDIESCRNVLIEYSTLNCGDDCFTIKSGRCEDGLRVGKATENVIIRYSLAKDGHGGITCGSETAGGMKNIYLYNCVFNGTQVGVRFKTRRNRAGGVNDILYEKIRMINVGEAFKWDLLGSERYMGELARRYPPRAVNKLTPVIKDIHIKDFIVESADKILSINGIPEIPCSNVLIENGQINSQKLIDAMNDVDGFTMRNMKIKAQDNKINILDGRNILFDNVEFTVPDGEIITNIKGEKSKNIIVQTSREKTVCSKEKPIKVAQLSSQQTAGTD
ncbi:glycoside hydrolase family 28 protein [Bacteroides ovatus]|uniref:glycoside hydrolase family 28 protein n=1 Tax=Bacteroides ovatus TaxID=28116 RepID=UPI003144E870